MSCFLVPISSSPGNQKGILSFKTRAVSFASLNYCLVGDEILGLAAAAIHTSFKTIYGPFTAFLDAPQNLKTTATF